MYDVLVTEDFSFRAEVDHLCQVNLHVDVTTWNKKVAKEMKKLFIDTKEAFRLEGFPRLYTITPNQKFVEMICGGDDRGSIDMNGKPHQVIVWELGD